MNEQSPFESKDTDPNIGGEPLESGETMSSAAQRGADRAKKIASRFIPGVKNAARKLSYGVAFGTAYGGSFAVTLIKEMTPNAVKEGCSEGIAAGRKTAENLLKPAKEEGEITSSESTGYAVT